MCDNKFVVLRSAIAIIKNTFQKTDLENSDSAQLDLLTKETAKLNEELRKLFKTIVSSCG